MDINATLLGQMLTFALLVWFTMKYVWPPILSALKEREQKIAAGLQAAEKNNLELAQTLIIVQEKLAAAKSECDILLKEAALLAEQIAEEARLKAKKEKERIIESAQVEIQQTIEKVKTELFKEVVGIAIKAAEHILEKNIQVEGDDKFLSNIIDSVSEG